MKIYKDQDIRDNFKNLLEEINSNDPMLEYLQIYGGGLSLALHTRIEQIQKGYVQCKNKKFELEKPKNAKSALKFKINTGTIESISADIVESYRLYSVE